MLEIAFVFPGQGSQSVGMGKQLYDSFPVARSTFDEADEVLGFSLSRTCFEGTESDLRQTAITQPALLCVSTAAARVLQEQGVKCTLAAGHSLGEYSALVSAKSLTFKNALLLVRERGKFMQHAVPPGVGAMAALLKLPDGKLESILTEAAESEVVSAANLNSPEQVVISGHAAAVERAMKLALQAGAKRAILLNVSAPFHCSLMQPAQALLAPLLEAAPFEDLSIPIINNWEAKEVITSSEARRGLIEQIPKAVQWTKSIQQIKAKGVDRFVEVGPGSVLSGLCRSIEPTMQGVKFGMPADLEKVHALALNGKS